MYDDVIYLSDSKLDAIVPRDRSWWRRLQARRLNAGINPGVVKLEADLEMPGPDKLAALAAKLDKVDELNEMSKWFEDPSLTAGELMCFEGWIGTQLVTLGAPSGAVLFCQLPEPGCRSVVLHGSAANLQQRKQAGAASPVSPVPYSDPSAAPDVVRTAVSSRDGSGLWGFWRGLGALGGPGEGGGWVAADMIAENLAGLYAHVVGTKWFRDTALHLGGVAYVSGIVPLPDGTEIVLGSPLCVRRVRPGS